METARRAHTIPGLDGLRTLAVAAVFALHAGLKTPGGQTGVYVFFALSGFLITSLLLQEWRRHGTILLGNFYLRRALRLYPAVVALVVAVTVYALVDPDAVLVGPSLRAVPAVLFYAANWVRAFAADGAQPLGLYEHTWSLAVEEQFYLLWPLVVLAALALGRRVVVVGWVAVVGFVLSVATQLLAPSGDGGHLLYNGLQTNAAFLLVGAAGGAFTSAADAAGRERLRAGLRWAFPPAALVLVVATFTLHSDRDGVGQRLALPLIAVACAVTVLTIALDGRLWVSRLLATTPMVYAGKRSYGFYLWHYPLLVALKSSGLIDGRGTAYRYGYAAIGLALSIAFSIASYRVVEQPFLRLKDRLAHRERASGGPAPVPVDDDGRASRTPS